MAYSTENICVKVGDKCLIDDISIDVKPGNFSVILGPNGAGKSTLLKVFSNDISPIKGDIRLEGTPIKLYKRDKIAKMRAVLPQSSNVTFNFTGIDIVKMGRIPYNESDLASASVIDEIMNITKTKEFANRQYNTLSGGERQRVQFARVLAQIWPNEIDVGKEKATKYLLLDEPTSALDPLYQLEILKIAKWLAKDKGFGVLAVLHDLNHAMSFADEIYLLKDGKLAKSGAPETVLDPATIQNIWGITIEFLKTRNGNPAIVSCMGE